MRHSRRTFCKTAGTIVGVGSLSGCLDSLSGGGSDFPSDQVEIVVPMGEGGGNDLYMRPLAEPLSDELDVDTVVVNEPPPVERYNQLYNQSDDGYEITIFNPLIWMPLMQQEGADSMHNGATWHSLGAPATSAIMLGIRKDAEASTWDEAVELSRTEDRVWRAGNQGAPSQGPYYNLLEERTDIQFETIEGFSSSAELVASMERGEVDMNLNPASSMIGFVDDGPVKPILTGEPEILGDPILETYADLGYEGVAPSFSEKGLDDMSILAQTLRAVVAPPEVSEDRVETLRDAVWSAVQSDNYQSALAEAQQTVYNPVNPDDMETIFQEKEEATMDLASE